MSGGGPDRMLGPDEIRRVADAALQISGVDGAEVLLLHEWGGLTRFAKSTIHQSTSRENTELRVRVAIDGRTGVAATNEFSEEGARGAARSAREMAGVSAPDPQWPGFAPAAPVPPKNGYDPATAEATPESRAEAVATLVAQCAPGFHAAGAFETQAAEVAVATTEGQFCHAATTQTSLTTVMSGGDGGAGFAEVFAQRADDVDAASVGKRAAAKASESQRPRDLEPGRYDVVLEPAAVSTLVGFLQYLGFGGRMLLEDRSCFSGKQGQLVAAPSITMVDDAFAPGALGLPFDFEGTPKQRVPLIDAGVFVDGVYDRRSAQAAERASTGHGLPAPNPEGPFPLNVVLQPGSDRMEDMIASTERGLLISRFHYTNVVNPTESVITGMTRDGTFLIEDGAVVGPVKNLRFTQSIIEAMTNAEMVGDRAELASEFFFSASSVPALKIAGFNFSSASDH